MKTLKITLIIIISILAVNVHAQIKITTGGNVGIKSLNPASMLSINGTGQSCVTLNSYQTDDVNYGIALYGITTGGSNRKYGVIGSISPLGSGSQWGVAGYALNSTPMSSGRAYGVMGCAGNATSGYNYAIQGWLNGTNNGAAIYGVAGQSTEGGSDEDTQGQYAGYFLGTVYMNSKLCIGYKSSSYSLDVNGIIRGTNVTPSDERLKENIKDMSSALSSITKLHGVNYKLKSGFSQTNSFKEKSSLKSAPDTGSFKGKGMISDSALYNRNHMGFLAQEVKKIFPELVYEDKDGMLSVDYVSLIPVLVESLKELNVRTSDYTTLQQDLQDTKTKLTALEKRLNQCCGKSNFKSEDITVSDATSQSAILHQNIPNPFNQQTDVKYYIPATVKQASLYVFNMQGSLIKTINITDRGNGAITINGYELQAGMYLYSLTTDGNEVDTKRMILTQ